MSTKYEISNLLGKFYIRYNVMERIIDEVFSNTGNSLSHLNVYLDINSMTKVLYSGIDFNMGESLLISASILNLCAHYRALFRRLYNVETTYYLVYSENLPMYNRKLIKDYNESYYRSINKNVPIKTKMDLNINCTQMISEYLPEIYTIKTSFETGVVMKALINRENNFPCGHMIITRDLYNYQLVNESEYAFILRPSTKDNTYYVTKKNIYEIIKKERGTMTELNDEISSELYSLVLSMCGCKSRNINSILNFNTSLKLIAEGIKDNTLVNGYNGNPGIFFSRISQTNPVILGKRFNVIDIRNQYDLYKSHTEFTLLDTMLIDKYDPQEVREICSKYYLLDPLDLEKF